MSVELKGNSGTFFAEGITSFQINQLIHYSRQDLHVRHFTSDAKRFSGTEEYYDWLKKGKAIYTLSNTKGDLSGIIWFAARSVPEANFTEDLNPSDYFLTFAIRMYSSVRGKGLGGDFINTALKKFKDRFMTEDLAIWLEVSEDNAPAINLYNRVGFKKVTQPNNKGKVIMINNLSSNWVLLK